MLKLFAFDLDGTLLVDRKIGGRNRDALLALQEAGVQICLVSGRVIRSPLHIAKDAGLSLYCMGSNGAIGANPDGEILFEQRIAKQSAEKLIALGLKLPAYFHFYSADSLHTPFFSAQNADHLIKEKFPYGSHMQCNIKILQPDALMQAADKMLKIQYVLWDHKEWIEPVKRELSKISGISVTMSGEGLLEAMAEGVDKWQGLSQLSQMLGIVPESICAMGDYRNDLEMIEQAGIGVAMGNASEEVKEKADLVTTSCWEYGVADAIWKLKEWGQWG